MSSVTKITLSLSVAIGLLMSAPASAQTCNTSFACATVANNGTGVGLLATATFGPAVLAEDSSSGTTSPTISATSAANVAVSGQTSSSSQHGVLGSNRHLHHERRRQRPRVAQVLAHALGARGAQAPDVGVVGRRRLAARAAERGRIGWSHAALAVDHLTGPPGPGPPPG
jgi:hypothetical protein